jgi:hypothetical protein
MWYIVQSQRLGWPKGLVYVHGEHLLLGPIKGAGTVPATLC